MSLSQLPRFVRALTCEPLAVERGFLDAFVGLVRRRGLEGLSLTGPEIHAELGVAMPAKRPAAGADRNIAVVPIYGAISNHAHSMGASTDQIGAAFDNAVLDPRVDGIVLDVDSPGGTIGGVPELAEKVFAARGTKPIVAVANGLMASAAYWIGAAADSVVVTRSGEGAGSVGVYLLHEDWTKAMEDEGVKVTEIAAGKFKTEGAPWKALDADAEAYLRARVEEAYGWFTKDVARFRAKANLPVTSAQVRDGYGEGRVLNGKAAVNARLADRVGSLEETVARMAEKVASRRRSRVATDVEFRQRVRNRST